MEKMTFKDDQPRNPYEHANTCSTTSVFVGFVLLIVGLIVSNVGHMRFEDVGVDWAGFGLWAGAAGVSLTVGQCAASICRQLADSLTP